MCHQNGADETNEREGGGLEDRGMGDSLVYDFDIMADFMLDADHLNSRY